MNKRQIIIKENKYVLIGRGPRWHRGQRARGAIAEVKQRPQRSVVGWVTKNALSRAPLCFGRHVKQLVPTAFTVVSTHSIPKKG
jgi:hypothetical protein